MHEDMIHVPDAFPTGIDDATHSSPTHLRKLHSPEYVEGAFFELRVDGVLRLSRRWPREASRIGRGCAKLALGASCVRWRNVDPP
jgi:hypothetical protein